MLLGVDLRKGRILLGCAFGRMGYCLGKLLTIDKMLHMNVWQANQFFLIPLLHHFLQPVVQTPRQLVRYLVLKMLA
jgi:hypothetical protein